MKLPVTGLDTDMWGSGTEYTWANQFAKSTGCVESDALSMLNTRAHEIEEYEERKRKQQYGRKRKPAWEDCLRDAASNIEAWYAEGGESPQSGREFASQIASHSPAWVWAKVLAWTDTDFRRLIQRMIQQQ